MKLTPSQPLIEIKHHRSLETKTLSETRLRKCRQTVSSPGGPEQHHQVKPHRTMKLANPLEIISRGVVIKENFLSWKIFSRQYTWQHCKQTLSLAKPTEISASQSLISEKLFAINRNLKALATRETEINRHHQSSRWKQKKQNASEESKAR